MTILGVALLLVILFLSFFIYFSWINPADITLYYLAGESVVLSPAILVLGCILAGFTLGMVVYLFNTIGHQIRHWKMDRQEKRSREIAKIYREGVNRLLSGDLKKAREILQKALERDATREETYIAIANIDQQDGDLQQAVTMLMKARQLNNRSLEVLFKLASVYDEAGRPADAEKTYEEILEIEGDNRKALRALRDLKARRNDWAGAHDLQKKVLKVAQGGRRFAEEEANALHIRYELARQQLETGEIDQAKSALKEIIKKSPDFTPARVTLGDVYVAQDRLENAANVWTKGYQDLKKGVFLARLEDGYMRAEDPSTLLAFYRDAISGNQDDMILRLFYGKFCLRLEMVDEAIDNLQTVEGSGATTPVLHALLAEAYRKRKNIDGAIKEYKLALGIEKQPSFEYTCQSCSAESSSWLSRCPKCGTWGEYILADRNKIMEAKPLDIRPIHHGER